MINRAYHVSVKNSGYEFSHWNKSKLLTEIGVLRLSTEVGVSECSWSEVVSAFLVDIWAQLSGSYKLYLYFSSTVWMPDTKINRYYGLWKKLIKEYADISMLNIISETCHESKSKIRFSGMACIQVKEIELLLPLVLNQRIGMIFAVEYFDEDTLARIENTIFNCAMETLGGRMEHMVNIPMAINTIIDYSGLIVYPNGNEDFGGMCLDVFGKSELIKKLSIER